MELWIGVVGVLMAALGGFVSVYPPQERQSKIVTATFFGAAGLLLIGLLWIHTSNNANEKQQAAEAQEAMQATLLQSQKEFRDFRGEIVNAQKETNKPGSADEKLDRINERLSKALGRPLPGESSKGASITSLPPAESFPPSASPIHFNGMIAVKGNHPQQLSALLKESGYKGAMLLFQLEICDPETSNQEFYLGQSDVSAKNGFKYTPGGCNTLWNQDAAQLYFFMASDGYVQLSATSR